MSSHSEKFNELQEDPQVNKDSFVSSNMSRDSETNLLGYLFKIGFGLILPPVFISFFSTYAYIQTEKPILLIPPFVSFFALISASLLTYLARYAQTSGTRASDYLLYSLYIMHICSAVYFLIGSLFIFIFAHDETLTRYVSFAILCIEGGCVKYIIGYGVIFVLIRKLTIEYQTIRNYLQIMQVTLIASGIGICLTCLAYKSSWDYLDISYHLPPVILDLGLATGIGLIMLSLLLFYAAYSEKLSIILLSQILTVLLMIFLLLYSAMVRFSNDIYISTINKNCSYLLKLTSHGDLTCGKYKPEPCIEEFRALVWEEDLEPGLQCLNSDCCVEIKNNITLSLEILVAWAFLSAILLIFSWLSGQGLVKKIEKYGKSSEKRFDLQALSIILVAFFLGIAGWIALANESAKFTEDYPLVKVLGAEEVEPRFLLGSLCENVEIKLNWTESSEVELSSKGGSVFPKSFKLKKWALGEHSKKVNFCPYFVREKYEILAEFIGNNE